MNATNAMQHQTYAWASLCKFTVPWLSGCRPVRTLTLTAFGQTCIIDKKSFVAIIDFHTQIVMRLNLPLWFSYLVTKRLLKFSRGGVNGDNYWCQDLHLAAQTYPRITRDYRSIYITPMFLLKVDITCTAYLCT